MMLTAKGKNTPSKPGFYLIMVRGWIDQSWREWFNGMSLTTLGDDMDTGFTILSGWVADQASLRGIMNHIWDLNLSIITLQSFNPPEKEYFNSSFHKFTKEED